MHISTTRGRQILHTGRKMTDSLNLLQSVDGRAIRRDPLVPEGNSGAEGNDGSALCWTLPELSIHFDQICKVASPARITHTLLSSGRLRHSFTLNVTDISVVVTKTQPKTRVVLQMPYSFVF